MKDKIAVIDDDIDFLESFSAILELSGYTVEAFSDSKEFVKKLQNDSLFRNDIFLIILDNEMPFSGEETLNAIYQIKKEQQYYVILLSAINSLSQKIKFIKLEVDDYIDKTADPALTLAIIKKYHKKVQESVSGEQSNSEQNDTRVESDWQINKRLRKITINNTDLKLTNKEFLLLSHLIEHQNQFFTWNEIEENVFGNKYIQNSNNVRVLVYNIKKKISAVDKEYLNFILSRHLEGWSFFPPPSLS